MRAGSAAPRGAAARSSRPPARSEAAPRDNPRGGAAVRRRGAGRAAGSTARGAVLRPWSCPGLCSSASWRPPSPRCPSSRSSTRLTSSCPSSTSSTSQVSADQRCGARGDPPELPQPRLLPVPGSDRPVPSSRRRCSARARCSVSLHCRLFYFCGRAPLFIFGEAAAERSSCVPRSSPLCPALAARSSPCPGGCRRLCRLFVPRSPPNAAFPAVFTRCPLSVLCRSVSVSLPAG